MSNVTFEYDIALCMNENAAEPVIRNTRKDGTGQSIIYDAADPSWFSVTLTVADLEAAKQITAVFPKYVNIKAKTIWSYETGTRKVEGYVTMDVRMVPCLRVGDANEAGARRIKGFFKTCAKNGFTVTRINKWGNSSPKSAEDYGC